MRKQLLSVALLATLAMGTVKAQVKGVSFTLSPTAEYQWWNKNINLKDGMFYGMKAGFGFGQNFELGAIYEHSSGLKGKMRHSDFLIPGDILQYLPGAKVTVNRFGGQMKVNLLRNMGISPFITAGAGVQYFNYDPFIPNSPEGKYKEQQVYLSYGAGVAVNLTKRVSVSLQARDMLFNMDDQNLFLNPILNDKSKRLHNWSAIGSLNIYLGGQNPYEKNNIPQSLRESLQTGFVNGMKFVMEPGMAYISFKDNDQLKDQWFLGGSLGMDFNSMVGVRAFYYQATKQPSKLDLKFNHNMSMYGLNFITRLNQTKGIAPYLSMGAGYLQTRRGLFSSINHPSSFKKTHLFGLFGAGLDIPLSRYFSLYGSANTMLMSDKVNPSDVTKTSQVKVNMMYKAGLRINIGRPVKSFEAQYAQKMADERDQRNREINALREKYTQKIADERQRQKMELSALQQSYKVQMDTINNQLRQAKAENDTLSMRLLNEERLRLALQKRHQESVIKQEGAKRQAVLKHEAMKADSIATDKAQKASLKAAIVDKKSKRDTIVMQPQQPKMMTAKEFKKLVDEVVKKVKGEVQASRSKLSESDMQLIMTALQNGQDSQSTAQAIIAQHRATIQPTPLEQLSVQPNKSVVTKHLDETAVTPIKEVKPTTEQKNKEAATQKEISELHQMVNEMGQQVTDLRAELAQRNMSETTPTTTIINPYSGMVETSKSGHDSHTATVAVPTPMPSSTMHTAGSAERKSFLRMNRIGILTGINLGEATSWNIGVRGYLQISNTPLDFVPEGYLGLGSKAAYGLSGNVVYNFSMNKKVILNPYAGLGLGVFRQKHAHFGTNILLGTSLNILGGKFFVDYSVRRSFKNNQLSLGYRFVF